MIAGKTVRVNTAVKVSLRPRARPRPPEPSAPAVAVAMADVIEATVTEVAEETVQEAGIVKAQETQVVSRVSTSGGRHWGINIGRYPSQYHAERVLLQTALNEISTLDGALRRVVRKPTGFDANFMGLTREVADLACRRLQARNQTCFMIGPS